MRIGIAIVSERELLVLGAAACLLILGLAAMGALHELHYRARARRIEAARTQGIEARIACLEAILAEDRLT